MFVFRRDLKTMDMGGGVLRHYLGQGTLMNAQHWNMADKSVVKMHQHSQEQFGYIIKGGFKLTIGDVTKELKAGDAYFVPPNVPHEFVTIGETEAIDVFNPVKLDFPWKD